MFAAGAAEKSVVDAAEVGAVFRLDGDALAGGDEEGHLNNKTGGHGGALVDVVGGVALHALGSLSHFHGDGGGKLDGANDFIREEEHVVLALDEVVLDGLNDILGNANVLEGLVVKEVVAHAVHIGELHFLAAEHDALQEVVGGKAEVVVLLGGDAADGHLNIGGHAGRGLELAFAHNTDVAVVIHGVTLAELNNGNFCHNARKRTRVWAFSQAFSRAGA